MNHTAVVVNLSIYFPANNYLKTNYTFLLGETNSDYTNILMSQVEGVFGSSLWLIDYLMYGMSLVSPYNALPHISDTINRDGRTLPASISFREQLLDTQVGFLCLLAA